MPKADDFFKCSAVINCEKSFIEEECNQCILELNKNGMHFCENHVLHSIHRKCIRLNNNELMDTLITLGSGTEHKDSQEDDIDEEEKIKNTSTNNDDDLISEERVQLCYK